MENKQNQLSTSEMDKIKSNLYYLYSRGMITKADLEKFRSSQHKGNSNETEKE